MESRLFAWLSAYLLSREHLPNDWRVEYDRLVSVGSQTGFEVDDLAAVTDRGGYVLIQAKHRLSLSERDDSDLASAIDQAVRQLVAEVPSESGGTTRPLRPGLDALVICTDADAPATTKRDLKAVVDRLATQPAEVPMEQVARNAGERKAVQALLGHLKTAFLLRSGGPPSDAQLREFCQLLHLVVLNVGSGGADRATALVHLKQSLSADSSSAGAWSTLLEVGQSCMEEQRWIDFDELRQALRMAGHAAGVDAPFAQDVDRLKALTLEVLQSDTASMTTSPEGLITVDRSVADLLTEADGSYVLIGDPGAGKSALARVVASRLADGGEQVVVLTGEALAATVGMTRVELALQNNLDAILLGWDGNGRATLVVDGIDRTRGASSAAWLPSLVTKLRSSRWRVIATIRTFDLRYGESWREALQGEPIDAGHADPEFLGIRHLVVRDFTDEELNQVREQSPKLGEILDNADSSLQELLRNPFNLSLAGRILVDGGEQDISAVRTRQGLLDLYWRRRVISAPDGMSRTRVVKVVSEEMVRGRRARVADPNQVIESPLLPALSGLLSDGVLREEVQARRTDAHPITFAHPVFFDFAVARSVLGADDPMNLSTQLDADPDLAITVRPSIDMHMADLWADDPTRESFWNLAVRLSASQGGHPIAAIAAACAALREHPSHHDLLRLEGLALDSSATGHAARFAVAHLAGALEAHEIGADDRASAAPALAELARELAAGALESEDSALADLARLLLLRLEHCFPLGVGAIGSIDRSNALRDITRLCLLHPDEKGMEQLARQVGQWLTKALSVVPADIAPIIEAVISPEYMNLWGVSVVDQLVVELGAIAVQDPVLAQKVARSVWDFEDGRDEAVPIGNSAILGLTSTRYQDLEMARFGTGEGFKAFLEVAPLAAIELFADLLSSVASPREIERLGRLPRIYSAQALRHAPGHEALSSISTSLAGFVADLAVNIDETRKELLDRSLESIVAGISHPEVWNQILEAAAGAPDTLGRLLLPLADGSDLFGHYATRASAGRLVSAMSQTLSGFEHQELERIVLGARDPLESQEESTQRSERALVGLLDSSKIVMDDTRSLFEEVQQDGGPTPIEEYLTPTGGFIAPQRLVERLEERGWPAGYEECLHMIDELETDVTQAQSANGDEKRLAVQRLKVLLPFIYEGLVAVRASVDPISQDQVLNYLVNGAELLASDSDIIPGSQIGALVLTIFLGTLH